LKGSYALAAGNLGARLDLINDAGHMCNLEMPDQFTHIVADFIGS
jgi:pimeloyl-ACP methyl ester carboxylesterase